MFRSLATRRFGIRGWSCLIAIAMAGVIVVAGPLLAQNAPVEEKLENPAPPAAKPAPAANVPAPVKVPAVLAARQQIEEKLKEKTQLNFTDTPLNEAMQFLGAQHKFPVLLETNALAEASIALDTPINQTLSDITLESAINIILKPLGLSYVIEDEVMKVTTKDVVEERLEIRIYDVKGLAAFGIKPGVLSKAIPSSIHEAQWVHVSGEGGSIFVVSDALIISQSQPRHREIQRLLDELTRLRTRSNPSQDAQANVPPNH